MKIFRLTSIFCLLLLCSCIHRADKLTLKESDFQHLDGWSQDDHAAALASFIKSCDKIKGYADNRPIHKSGVGGKSASWKAICSQAVTPNLDARSFFETNFKPYQARNRSKDVGLFTGYYEAELKGSRHRYGPYQYPLYKKPSDLQSGTPYYSRADIESGALDGKGLELAWVDDPVRAFFMQVQGSGRVTLDDGSVMRVGYDGQNGHSYIPIGRYMRDQGFLEKDKVSAQTIQAWLYSHPQEQADVMNQNPSFIFFREIGEDGPIGGQGVALTPMRSLAIDKRFIPYGAPVWLDTAVNGQENSGLKRLLIAQDTGGAIRGPVRGDVFFGYGPEAEHLAGYQNSPGKYFILLPKKL